jgi:hypothetical protein
MAIEAATLEPEFGGRTGTTSSHPISRLRPAPRTPGHVHLGSAQKAAKTFENFRLSSITGAELPPNYVEVGEPKGVQAAQRELIIRELRARPSTDPQNRGVTITFARADLDQAIEALPGMSERGGEVPVAALLAYLRARMNGTSFYSIGNTAMNRLTSSLQARSKAKAIIERIKSGSHGSYGASDGASPSVASEGTRPHEQVAAKNRGARS